MTLETMAIIDKLMLCEDKTEEKQLIMELIPEAKEKMVDLYVQESFSLGDSWLDDVMSTENINKRFKLIHRNFTDAPKAACQEIAEVVPFIPITDERKRYVEKTYQYTENEKNPHITQEFTEESWRALAPKERYIYRAMMRDPELTYEGAAQLIEQYVVEIRTEMEIMRKNPQPQLKVSPSVFEVFKLCLQGTAYLDRIAKLYELAGYGKDAEDSMKKAYEHYLNSLRSLVIPNYMLKAMIGSDPDFRDL